MINICFTVVIALLFWLLARWAFRVLPGESWQIMASVPVVRKQSGEWVGTNLTYYGLFVAFACVVSVALFLLLMGTIGFPAMISVITAAVVMGICVPASKGLARMVEKKHHTLTVGGASFVGLLITPWVLLALEALGPWGMDGQVRMLPALAALSISYAVGEGLGRLACISFGCCYGKPLSACHPWIQRMIGSRSFVFSGPTKKISYESGLEGERVVPVQAITSVFYVGVALISMLFFLNGHYRAALGVSMISAQVWRVLSETLRADYRGGGSISAYQIMALAGVVYTVALLWILPCSGLPSTDLASGLKSLWDPVVGLFLQALGVAVFMFSGISRVTGSTLLFFVISDRL